MKKITFAVAAFVSMFSAAGLLASTPKWLNVYINKTKSIGEVTRVVNIPTDSIASMRFGTGMTADRESECLDSLCITLKNSTSLNISTDSVPYFDFGINIPLLTITTTPEVNEISSKTEYLEATIVADCYGKYDSMGPTAVNIRGRGNTTWVYPKKPYRLKFSKKQSLCGLKKAKSFVLIANYLDNTLMRNTMAFKMAQLLGLEYTNHSIPVDVVLNGKYKGSYMLSEKVGINSGSVDIDETLGILWELDTNYDEDFKFISPYYSTKVMVKDPDFIELAEDDPSLDADALFEKWKMDYVRFEKSVVEDRWTETLDLKSTVDYVLVNHLSGNRELNHPKSFFMYKEHVDSLYKLGPVWDFDWGFNYINAPDLPLFGRRPNFILPDIVKSPVFQKAFAERWAYFKKNLYPQLMEYFDEYAAYIRVSALKNGETWPFEHWWRDNYDTTETFDQNLPVMREWIEERVRFIDTAPYFGLFVK